MLPGKERAARPVQLRSFVGADATGGGGIR
jgi:hypothetical protein